MPWAAPLQGSVHWEVGRPGSAEEISTCHTDTGDCPASKTTLALSLAPLAQVCLGTSLEAAFIRALVASRCPVAPNVVVSFLSDQETGPQ